MKNNPIVSKILIISGAMLGLIVIFIAAVSKTLVSGLDTEGIKTILKYSSYFGGNIDTETGIMITIININQYFHWIITFGIIWIVFFMFIWENNRRSNENEE